MPRYANRVDRNHAEVKKDLEAALPGVSVFDAFGAGKGFPDLVVGYRGLTYLYEVKDGEKSPSARKLTNAQLGFHGNWQGHVAVVCSAEEILADMLERSLAR
tara:strand:+ start:111 stop:416 length:306 start_codon:yes stop_codon:yes gene_type:complete